MQAYARLDESLRAYTTALGLEPGEMVTSWVAVAGIRRPAGGGGIAMEMSDDSPPIWQVRGMLTEAISALDRDQICADLSGD
jgi:hypothetical protein